MVKSKFLFFSAVCLMAIFLSCDTYAQTPVITWGDNEYGQLGDNSGFSRETPDTIEGISNAIAVAAGMYHSLIILNNGAIEAWGANDCGQLGSGTVDDGRYNPDTVLNINNAVSIEAGSNYSMALLADSTIRTWGANGNGQLGNATNADTSLPVAVYGINNAVAVAAGMAHSLAILSDGTIKAWGANDYGQLGIGDTGMVASDTPVTVLGINNATAIAAGDFYSLALLADGTIKAWGANDGGQLGDSLTADADTPVTVYGINSAIAIAAGAGHALAILSGGTMKAWGDNMYGQLGDSSVVSSNIPVEVSGINNATKIAAGWHHSLALLSDGTIKAWGDGIYGQLGDGTFNDADAPVNVIRAINCVDIAAGDIHSLALGALSAVEERKEECNNGISLLNVLFKNEINLLIPVAQKIEYTMYDVCGRMVLNKKEISAEKGELIIKTPNLKPGVYFISIGNINKTSKLKLIKVL